MAMTTTPVSTFISCKLTTLMPTATSVGPAVRLAF
jgi:hypothetical protein